MRPRKLIAHTTLVVVTLSLALLFTSSIARAALIQSPVAAPVNTLGTFGACCDIGNIIDGSGLVPGFASGTTDFDVYIGLNPLHNFSFLNNEFFGTSGVLGGTIVLDMGSSLFIDRLALWNEDSTGIASMTIRSALDLGFTSGVVNHGAFNPAVNPLSVNYPAEVFALTPSTIRFVEIQLQCNVTGFNNCGIGEIALSVAQVPESATLLLMGLGLAGLGLARHRRNA